MNNLQDLTRQKEIEQRTAAHVAYAVASDSHLSGDEPLIEMRRKGFTSYGVHVKAAQDALTVEDVGIALAPLSSATLTQTLAGSLLGKLDGFQRFSLTEFLRVQSARIDGFVVNEGETKPVSVVAFSAAGPPIKSAAMIVATKEFLRAIDSETQTALARQLTGAASAALDDAVIAAFLAAASASANAAPATLLHALGNPAQPALIGGFNALAARAGELRDLRDLGVQIVVSAAAGTRLFAIDAAMLAVALSNPFVQVARDANVQLSSTGSPDDGEIISLFQSNHVALRSELYLRLALAPGSVAYGSL
jgi:hypothetical protein